MKTILVTGGAGFIGSHLCKRLLNSGNKVICMDNFYTGQRRNISDLENNTNFKIIEHDITNPFPEMEHVDEIYNFACPASPVHYQAEPIKTIQVSTIGVMNVLEFAKKNNSKILQASTSEIYGDPKIHPQPEDYRGCVNTLGPRACYDEGKRVAETLFMEYYRKGLDIRIVRIFNTYGPNMAVNDGRVVSNFIIQAINGKDITIYGDGTQTRSFQYIKDLLNGVTKLMEQNEIIGPVNIGNPDEYTIKELAKKIIEFTNTNSKIIYEDLPIDDPKKRRPDISLAKEKLNWSPEINVDLGLKETIKYFESIK